MKYRLKNQRGDTIIEVLFAMTIIGIVLAAAYAVASKNLQVSQLSKERTQATELAIAQLDQLKALEEQPELPGNGTFCLDITNDPSVVSSDEAVCTVDGFKRIITKDGSNYAVRVEWTPPGGSDANKSVVEFFYSDFNFSLQGNSNLVLNVINQSADRTSATLGAAILNQSGSVLQRGIVYSSAKSNPVLGDTDSTPLYDNGTGSQFTASLTNLNPNIVYYAKVFLVFSAVDIRYSNAVAINSSGANQVVPQIQTVSASNIAQARANVNARVIRDNGSEIVERGIAYGTVTSPTITNGRAPATTNGVGDYTVTLTGLKPATRYYAKAYAINTLGVIAYGDAIPFDTLSPPSNLVDRGSFGNSRYYLSNEAVSWSQAKAAAEALGGHLVTITSSEENDFVANFADGPNIWIGLSDSANEGTWVWVTGETSVFRPWNSPPQPDNWPGVDTVNGEDHAMLYTSTALKGRWNDLSNFDLARYVVEFR